MEGCLYYILIFVGFFAFAAALSAVIATIMSVYTLLFCRRWDWTDHFMRVFDILLSIVSFILRVTPSGSRFGGGSSRGGGSGRKF